MRTVGKSFLAVKRVIYQLAAILMGFGSAKKQFLPDRCGQTLLQGNIETELFVTGKKFFPLHRDINGLADRFCG